MEYTTIETCALAAELAKLRERVAALEAQQQSKPKPKPKGK